MINDIDKAKELLNKPDMTCVLVKGDTVYTSMKKGIAPMLGFIAENADLHGFSCADTIVGKAAAMLFSLAGVTNVYGKVMSKSAVSFLNSRGIQNSYGELADNIINRRGDGMCPMEMTVANIDSEQEGHKALVSKVKELSGK